MKKMVFLFLLVANISLIHAQSSDIDSVKALKVDKNILELSQSTIDIFQLYGLQFYINQYYNVSDWNNDGLGDLVIMIGFNEAINDDDYLSLFLQKKTDQKIEFIEDPNYLMSIQGHIEDFNSSVGDLNGDNLLDIVVATHNYHGPEGKQPSYYLGKSETTDKLFINTGEGLTRFELDKTTIHQNQNIGGVPEHMPTSGITVLDWDFDGKLEILVSDQAYRRIREVSNPVKDRLFSSFEIDANNNITREFVFDWDLPLNVDVRDYIQTRMHFLSVINDTLYLLHYKKKGWDIENSIFVDEKVQRPNSQEIVWHADAKVLVIDMKKSFGKEGLIKEITLESTHKGGDLIYQDGFHPSDIDNDGKVEFLAMYWYESKFKQVPFIKIYDDDGTDVTDKWLGDKYMETSLKGGGNGLQMGDFNNDGFIDFTPKDGWRYNAQTHSPPKVEGENGTFAIFLNDGEKFNQYNVDFTDFDQSWSGLNYGGGSQYTRNPVDFDNDGYYEFLILKNQIIPPPNIDIVTVNYKNNIEDISDVSIKEDSIKVIKLSAADLKGDAISYSAKSSENNVSAGISNDTLTLTPALNWHGDAQVTAYASGSSWKWKDSTTFKLTVTPVNDAPTAFEWVSSTSDTVNITQSNLADTYTLQWGASTDPIEGDAISYLIYAKIGVNPPEEIYDTTSTSVQITYEEFLENVFELFSMLPGATVKFSVVATDGIDTVKVTGDDRVLFVNRYEYLSIAAEGIPLEFALHENYPNPFNPTTTLRFDLPEVSDITLTIYNMLGQKVRTFDYQNTSAGYHSVTWDATNDLGEQVGAGVYLYQLQAKDFVKTRKMVLLK